MNGNYHTAYKQASVNTSTPGKLLVMLFDGLIRFIVSATNALESGDLSSAHAGLIRAQEIVVELKTSLNPSVAPELCDSLRSLYDYFYNQLILANTQKSSAPLEGMIDNIRELRDAFAAAEDQVIQSRSE